MQEVVQGSENSFLFFSGQLSGNHFSCWWIWAGLSLSLCVTWAFYSTYSSFAQQSRLKNRTIDRAMQATNNCSNGTRRRRRRLGVCSQFLLAVTAVTVWLCISGIRPTNSADAFVSPLCFSCSDKSSKLRQGVRPKWGASSPETARSHLSHLAPDSISQGHRSARMVIGEPPSAACLRSLQRAWEASSSEATGHLEQQQQQVWNTASGP